MPTEKHILPVPQQYRIEGNNEPAGFEQRQNPRYL